MPKPEQGSKTAVVRTVVWFLVAVSIVCCGIRFTAKSNKTTVRLKRLSIDDWLVIAALILSIFQTVTVDIAVTNGLGEHIAQVSSNHLGHALRSIYASHFFYALTLCAAKCSAIELLRSLTPRGRHRWLGVVIGAIVLLWSLSGIFAMAFECNLPQPWDFVHGKCYSIASWWSYFEAINIITDLALIALPFWMICGIHSTFVRKLKLFFPFALRTGAIAACIVKIYIWTGIGTGPTMFDHTWKAALCDATIQCLAILPVCTIYLKQFLDSLDAGVLPADDYNRERDAPRFGDASDHGSAKNPLKPHGYEAYVRLQGETRRGSLPEEKDRDDTQRHLPRTAAQAYRGKTAGGERPIPLDQIEMRRDVTIEEAPWREGDPRSDAHMRI